MSDAPERFLVELTLEQRGRAIVAEDEAARLREAIREMADDYQSLMYGECSISVLQRLRKLADPEGGKE